MADNKSTKKNTKKGTQKKVVKKTTTTTTKKETKPVVKKEVVKETPKKVETKPEVKEIKKEENKVEVKEVKKEEVKADKKKIITIASIILAAIIIVIIIIVAITSLFNKEKKISKRVEEMGKDFYSKYYYVELSKNRDKKELEKVLSKFEKIGIKINLENLSVYSSGKYNKEIETFKSKKKECDKKNSKVIIYPTKPYGKNDYKIEVELDCGF